jgi:hypothetical protein
MKLDKNWPLPEICRNKKIQTKRFINDWRNWNGIYQRARSRLSIFCLPPTASTDRQVRLATGFPEPALTGHRPATALGDIHAAGPEGCFKSGQGAGRIAGRAHEQVGRADSQAENRNKQN